MPFIIKTTETDSDRLTQRFGYFAGFIRTITKKKFFFKNNFQKQALISTDGSEAEVFLKLKAAQETKDELRNLNNDYVYAVVEVEQLENGAKIIPNPAPTKE